MAKTVVIKSVRAGVNNRLSPRLVGGDMPDGEYVGPMYMLKNVDRDDGVIAAVSPPRIIDVWDWQTAKEPNTMVVLPAPNDEKRYADASEYHEQLWMCANADPNNEIVRVVPDDSIPTWETWGEIDAIPTGTSIATATEIVPLSDKHLLVYSGVEAVVMDIFNHAKEYSTPPSGQWKANGMFLQFRGAGGPEDVNFTSLSARWAGKYISFYYSGGYYGPYRISSVYKWTNWRDSYDVVLTTSTGLSNVTLDPAYFTIRGRRQFGIPAPPSAPRVEAYTGASTLVGSYQYCVTYGTSDGFESNPSPWSDVISLQGAGVLVYDLPLCHKSDQTHLASTNIDRVHVYRRGGMLGSTALRIATYFIPWAAAGYSNNVRQKRWTGQLSGSIGTTLPFYLYDWWDNPSQTWGPTYGCVARFTPVFQRGELVKFTGLDTNNRALTGLTRNYDGAGQDTWADKDGFVLVSHLDTVPDATLAAGGYPELETDHDMPPQDVGLATMIGNSLAVVRRTTEQHKVYLSSPTGWPYFPSKTPKSVSDYTEPFTGVVIPVGSERFPVTAIAPFKDGVSIIFKEHEAYALEGSHALNYTIYKLPLIPGCNKRRTIVTHRGYLFWVSGKNIWLYDGANLLNLASVVKEYDTSVDKRLWQGAYYQEFHVAYGFNSKVVLHYSAEDEDRINNRYIMFDFDHPITGPDGRLIPSPTTGGPYQAYCAAVSRNRANTKDVVYAIRFDHTLDESQLAVLWDSLAIGTPMMPEYDLEIETPHFAICQPGDEASIEDLVVEFYTTGALGTATIQAKAVVDGVSYSDSYELGATTSATLQTLRERPPSGSTRHGAYVGLKLVVPAGYMLTETDKRRIERLLIRVRDDRRAKQGIS